MFSTCLATRDWPRSPRRRLERKVTHVDASKKSVGWARENQALSGLDEKPIRWIVEDALKYVQREGKARRQIRWHHPRPAQIRARTERRGVGSVQVPAGPARESAANV
ncbi:MAG: hypothetical protein M0C28_44350 [Candidatus Moduliflexus flocculans]|nr:hypothetical protein [Candidatus Moduliflexus flocculans]